VSERVGRPREKAYEGKGELGAGKREKVKQNLKKSRHRGTSVRGRGGHRIPKNGREAELSEQKRKREKTDGKPKKQRSIGRGKSETNKSGLKKKKNQGGTCRRRKNRSSLRMGE